MNEEITIRVAVLASEPLGYGSGKHYFPTLLDGYGWSAGGRSYRFSARYVYDEDVSEGRVTNADYDVFLMPGGGVGDGEAVTKAMKLVPSVRRWRKALQDFVKAGGGYVGVCGGAALMTELDTGREAPHSLLERFYDASSLGLSCVKSYYNDLSLPLLTMMQRRFPERVGATSYVFSFAPGSTEDGKRIHTGGVPVDFVVDKNNPLFGDYQGDRMRMRWWAGPGLIVPMFPDREVKVLARYPNPDFSQDPSTRAAAWRYTGGLLGVLHGVMDAVKTIVRDRLSWSDIVSFSYYLARPWQKSDKNIDLDCAGRPAMTAEVYPNENQGRIVLSAPHPEYMVWWGGRIDEVEESSSVCLGKGMHRWSGIAPLSDSVQAELTHSWWVVRRMVAWAAKVPDDAMPPIEEGQLNDAARKIIETNVFWDGTLYDQMRNI